MLIIILKNNGQNDIIYMYDTILEKYIDDVNETIEIKHKINYIRENEPTTPCLLYINDLYSLLNKYSTYLFSTQDISGITYTKGRYHYKTDFIEIEWIYDLMINYNNIIILNEIPNSILFIRKLTENISSIIAINCILPYDIYKVEENQLFNNYVSDAKIYSKIDEYKFIYENKTKELNGLALRISQISNIEFFNYDSDIIDQINNISKEVQILENMLFDHTITDENELKNELYNSDKLFNKLKRSNNRADIKRSNYLRKNLPILDIYDSCKSLHKKCLDGHINACNLCCNTCAFLGTEKKQCCQKKSRY